METSPPSLTPPLRFKRIQQTLSIGSYPRSINYRFLKNLNLKTMIAISTTDDRTEDPELQHFLTHHGIDFLHVPLAATKKQDKKTKTKTIPLTHNQVIHIVEKIIDSQTQPVYLYCNSGGACSSLIVACLRKLSFWSSISIFNEFLTYTKSLNHSERLFIEQFHGDINLPHHRVDWLWRGMSKGVIDNHPSLNFHEYINVD